MKKLAVLAAAALALVACSGSQVKSLQGNTLKSPDGRLELKMDVVDGIPMYALSRDGADVILPSRLGFELFGEEDNLKDGFSLTKLQQF